MAERPEETRPNVQRAENRQALTDLCGGLALLRAEAAVLRTEVDELRAEGGELSPELEARLAEVFERVDALVA